MPAALPGNAFVALAFVDETGRPGACFVRDTAITSAAQATVGAGWVSTETS